MLDAEAGVFFRQLLLDLFVNSENAVYRQVAIGVSRELPTCRVRLAPSLVELLAAGQLQSDIVIGDPDVGLREPSGSFRDRAVGILLYAADAHPFVAETGVNPSGHEMIERSGGDVTVHTHRQFAGVARILIALHVFGRGVGVAGRSDSLAGKEFGDQCRAAAIVFARAACPESVAERLSPRHRPQNR